MKACHCSRNRDQLSSFQLKNHLHNQMQLTWRFNNAFPIARHWSLSWARCIQFPNFHPVFSKIHSNIILPPTLASSELSFLSSLSDQIGYAFLISFMHIAFSTSLILLHLIILIIFGEAYKLCRFHCALLLILLTLHLSLIQIVFCP